MICQTNQGFTRKTRNDVARASDGSPVLQAWLDRITAIGHPLLTAAVDGIWCGRSGRVTTQLSHGDSVLTLCVGWYNGRVEFSYLS